MSDINPRTTSVVTGFYDALPRVDKEKFINRKGENWSAVSDRKQDLRDYTDIPAEVIDTRGTAIDANQQLVHSWNSIRPAPGIVQTFELQFDIPRQDLQPCYPNHGAFGFIDHIVFGVGDQQQLFTFTAAQLYLLKITLNEEKKRELFKQMAGVVTSMQYLSWPMTGDYIGNPYQQSEKRLRIELFLPWNTNDVFGQGKVSDWFLSPDNRNTETFYWTVYMKKTADCFIVPVGATLANIRLPVISMVTKYLPKSIPVMEDFLRKEASDPMIASVYPYFYPRTRTEIPARTYVDITMDLSTNPGYTSGLFVWVSKESEEITRGNGFDRFIQANRIEFSMGSNPPLVLDKNILLMSKYDLLTRTYGDILPFTEDNVYYIPIGALLDTTNYSGFVSLRDNTPRLVVRVYNASLGSSFHAFLNVMAVQPATFTDVTTERGVSEFFRT